MLTYVVAFALAFAIATGATPVIRRLALRHGLVDPCSSRKVHTRSVPRIGGIAIVIGSYASLAAVGFFHDQAFGALQEKWILIAGLFGGSVAIALLGLYDDLRGVSALTKLVAQLCVAVTMYALGCQILAVTNPFGSTIYLGAAAAPFTVLWIVGVTNALNLIDGLDGLASGVAFFAVATNFLIAVGRSDVLMSLLMLALAGAILGFLLFNFNPASIFMGDTGSMFLGFVLAVSSIITAQKGTAAVSILVPMLALGLPIMDTLLTVVRRVSIGRPLFGADDEHIHHELIKAGYTHRRAVLSMYCLCVFFTLAALGLMFATAPQAAAILAVVGGVVFMMMRRLGYLYRRAARERRRSASAVEYR
jgi:UDP-GlcNAc:undecaprenyl-phosphate/decaprenyl-phosphate GlcNAc-1-phosphate transferase